MLCPGRSVGCRGPALTDRGPAVKGGELLMGLSMQPLSQARLEASGRSAGGSRSALRPHPQTCGAGESEPRQDPTFNLTCPTSRSIVSQEGPIMTSTSIYPPIHLSVCLSIYLSVCQAYFLQFYQMTDTHAHICFTILVRAYHRLLLFLSQVTEHYPHRNLCKTLHLNTNFIYKRDIEHLPKYLRKIITFHNL